MVEEVGRKKTILIIAAILIVALTVGGIFLFKGGKKPSEEEETKLDKVKVRLKWLHSAQFAGFYAAQEKGFYKEEGIEVTLNPGGIDFPSIQIVSEGEEQFGLSGTPQLLLAKEKGVPVVALATIFRKDPGILISLKDSNIKEPKDLIGKKVGVEFGTSVEQAYRAMMKNARIDISQITEVPQKYDYTPLLTGKIDACFYWAMGDLLQRKDLEFNTIWPSDYGVNFYADTLFTTEEMIEKNPDLVKRFVRATLRGWDYAYDHPEETATYILTYSDQLDKDRLVKYIQTSSEFLKPDDKPIGYMEKNAWEKMQQALLEGGFMKSKVEIDKIYTDQFFK